MSERQQSHSEIDSICSPYELQESLKEQIIDNFDKDQEKILQIKKDQSFRPIKRLNLLPLAIPRNSPQKRCFSCRASQSSSYKSTELILIELQNQEYYCDSCLQELYIEQQIKMRKIQEKYIYQKEFETSGMANQLTIFNQGNQNEEKQYINSEREVLALQNQYKALTQKVQHAKKQCAQLQDKVFSLEKKEDRFWQDINKFEKRALKLEQKYYTAQSRKQQENAGLEKLSKANILHSLFRIQIQDHYGQVYGLTVGKRPDMLDINWEHTNAGLAHLLLAYNYLSLKYGIPYTRIESMKIQGTLSQILLKSSHTVYSISYSRQNQKYFGLIMDTLLLELNDLAQNIQEIQNIQYSDEFKLPFPIDKKEVKILDLYVNPSKIEEKSKWSIWTKSMRYFLIDFKHLLTISSLHDPYL